MRLATGDVVISSPRLSVGDLQTIADGRGVPTALFRQMAHRSDVLTKRTFDNPLDLARYTLHKERMRHMTLYEEHVGEGIRRAGGEGLISLYEFFLWPVPDRVTLVQPKPSRQEAQYDHLVRARRDTTRPKKVYMEPGTERGFKPDFVLNAFDAKDRQIILNPHASYFFTRACGKEPVRYVEKLIDFRKAYGKRFRVVMICDVTRDELQAIFDTEKIPYKVEDVCDEYVYIHNGAVTKEEEQEEINRARDYVQELIHRPGMQIQKNLDLVVKAMDVAFVIAARVEVANRLNEGKLLMNAESV